MHSTPATLCNFPGRDALIAVIDQAIEQGHGQDAAIAHHLQAGMQRLLTSGSVQLPGCCMEIVPGRYARRELYRSPEHGYGVIAMTWGPGQGTPIHDHSGMWCVEGVWSGRIEVTPYRLESRDGTHCRFVAEAPLDGATGSAGSLIPPHEYHTIRNAGNSTAVTIHVYARPMERCGIFQEAERRAGWHAFTEVALALDAAA